MPTTACVPARWRRCWPQRAVLRRAVLVYGDYNTIDSEGRQIGRRDLLRGRRKPSGDVLARLAAGNFIVNGGIALTRAEAFRAIGGFDDRSQILRGLALLVPPRRDRRVRVRTNAPARLSLAHGQHHERGTADAAGFPPGGRAGFRRPGHPRKLPAHLAPTLRRAAEVHLVTYAAAQAVRFRGYRKAARYVLMAARRSPLAMPRVALRVGLAFLGI